MHTFPNFENIIASEIQSLQFFSANEKLARYDRNPIVGEVDIGQSIWNPRTFRKRFVADRGHLIVIQYQLEHKH